VRPEISERSCSASAIALPNEAMQRTCLRPVADRRSAVPQGMNNFTNWLVAEGNAMRQIPPPTPEGGTQWL